MVVVVVVVRKPRQRRQTNLVRGELRCGDLHQTVDVGWVGNVLLQVLDWSLSSDNSLNEESQHGEHSKSSVLELLNLELSEDLWVVSKSKGVEGISTRIKLVRELVSGWELATCPVGLDKSHHDDLNGQDSDDGLGVDQAWVSEVVKSALVEDEGTSLEPRNVLGGVEGLWKHATEGTEHSPPAVEHFG